MMCICVPLQREGRRLSDLSSGVQGRYVIVRAAHPIPKWECEVQLRAAALMASIGSPAVQKAWTHDRTQCSTELAEWVWVSKADPKAGGWTISGGEADHAIGV